MWHSGRAAGALRLLGSRPRRREGAPNANAGVGLQWAAPEARGRMPLGEDEISQESIDGDKREGQSTQQKLNEDNKDQAARQEEQQC